MDCVTESHNGHTLGKLTDYIADQKQEIRQYVDKLSKTDIPKTEGDIKENGQHAKNGRYQKMIEGIRRQGKRMTDDIDNAVDLLVGMCTELEELNADISEKNKTALTKFLREDLKPELDRCQEVLTAGTTVDVTSLAREIRNGVSTAPPTLSDLQKVEFKPGTFSTELLKCMLGKLLVDGVDESYKPIPKGEHLYEFKMSFSYDTCQTCLTNDKVLLSYWDGETISRVDLKGKLNDRIECYVKVSSISVSPTTGGVLFCVCDYRSIREITTGGDIVTRFHVGSTPTSLCFTSDDIVVVGMKGGIQLYTTDGRAVSAAAGGPCRQEAAYPHHMTSRSLTGDVAAVDNDVLFSDYMAGKKTDKQPRVIVMDKHLNLKYYCKDIGTRKTQGTDTQSSKFYPHDVCFDRVGDVLVTESVSKSVLLIDRNTGHYMRTVYTSDRRAPYCISLRNDGSLWVGHKDGKTTKVIQYE